MSEMKYQTMASRDSNQFSTFDILQWKSFSSHEGKRKSRQSTKPNKTKKHVVFSGVAGSGLHCVFLAGPWSSDNRLSAGDICESDLPTLRSALK